MCESYKDDVGEYPDKLEDLHSKPTGTNNWNGPYSLETFKPDPWQTPFRYTVFEGGETYEIRSAGPDREFDTEDDIVSERVGE